MTDRIGLIERYYKEVLEGGNLALLDELTADDYVNHEDAPILGQPTGKDGAIHFVTALRTAFPDLYVKAMGPEPGLAGRPQALTARPRLTQRGCPLPVAAAAPPALTVGSQGLTVVPKGRAGHSAAPDRPTRESTEVKAARRPVPRVGSISGAKYGEWFPGRGVSASSRSCV